VQECPQPPPGPTSHAGQARTGTPTDRSRSLAIGRAVRGSQPDQSVDHRPCLPVFFRWLHFRQPRRQQPHVAAHSSDHRIGSGLRPRDRRPFAGARHPLRPHSARSSSAGHRWPAARHASWLTLITSSGRHIMRRSMRQAPSAASTRPPRRTAAVCAFSLTSRITQRERRSPLASAAPRLRKINSAQRPSAAGRATAGSASSSATGAGPSLATRSPSVIPASASALAPAVKRTMPMLCYGRAPAVRQPAWYPVRAAAE